MGRNRLADPSWKSGPVEQKPTDSEHAIDPETTGYDHDGVGVDEADRVDGEALCAVREAYSCHREGCDVSPSKAHVYALSDVSERVVKAARHAISWTDEPTTEDIVEYLDINAVVVDYDHVPILGFGFGDDTFGYVYPNFTDEDGFAGPCYGHVEPDPEPMWRDI